jgi:hypothetical protein
VTAGDPLVGSLDPFAALADDDTEGCLCLIAGYAKSDGLIARVAAEAERRVMMSPALGDVLQLRYVDLGPQPGQAGDRSRPVRRIVADLMAVQETAGRSHFALIVIAKSAITIEGILGSCAAEPFLAGLRMRLAGIANSDDREHGSDLVDITSSPSGSWRSEKELIDAVRRRCEELPGYFMARGDLGLTCAEFAALRQPRERPTADGDGPEGDADGAPNEAVAPDVLDDVPDDVPGAGDMAADQDTAPAADGVPARSAAGRPTPFSPARWLPGVPWGRGRQAAKADDPDAAAPAGPARTAMGLVYLLMIVDEDAAADPELSPLRAALADLDRRLAEQPLRGYQVRVIHGSDGDLHGELQEAGNLDRRAAKRAVKAADFRAVLKGIRGSLRRDLGLVETIATAAGLTVAPPAVVFFTADPPMADPGAAAVFGELAAEATVAWVVPGRLEGLVSPAFGSSSGAVVLDQHPAVVDEILYVMRGDVLAS